MEASGGILFFGSSVYGCIYVEVDTLNRYLNGLLKVLLGLVLPCPRMLLSFRVSLSVWPGALTRVEVHLVLDHWALYRSNCGEQM